MQHYKLSKNTRFHNTVDHRCPLRSKSNISTSSFKSRAADVLLVQHMFSEYMRHKIQHVFKVDSTKETIDSVCKGCIQNTWLRSLSNEWGRLTQGNDNGVHFSDDIEFISKNEVSYDRD